MDIHLLCPGVEPLMGLMTTFEIASATVVNFMAPGMRINLGKYDNFNAFKKADDKQ
jgi:hypothetical protein